jgi:hypothetical protein
VTPEQVPDNLIEILDRRAGKRHSRQGSVVSCLAEILTEYDRSRNSNEMSKMYYYIKCTKVTNENHSEYFSFHFEVYGKDVSRFIVKSGNFVLHSKKIDEFYLGEKYELHKLLGDSNKDEVGSSEGQGKQ